MEIPMRTEVSHQVRINDLASPPEVPDVRGMLLNRARYLYPLLPTSGRCWYMFLCVCECFSLKPQESWCYINRWLGKVRTGGVFSHEIPGTLVFPLSDVGFLESRKTPRCSIKSNSHWLKKKPLLDE